MEWDSKESSVGGAGIMSRTQRTQVDCLFLTLSLSLSLSHTHTHVYKHSYSLFPAQTSRAGCGTTPRRRGASLTYTEMCGRSGGTRHPTQRLRHGSAPAPSPSHRQLRCREEGVGKEEGKKEVGELMEVIVLEKGW